MAEPCGGRAEGDAAVTEQRPDDASGDEVAGEGGRFSRRGLLTGGAFVVGGAVGAGITLGATSGGGGTQTAAAPAAPKLPLRALTPSEADAVTAMAERIFPKDASGPGATDAGVTTYIDGQLAGGWGNGERQYMQAPFHEPQDSGHGYQLPLTPRDLYKRALAQIDAHCRKRYGGKAFTALSASQQDEVLTALESGKVDLRLAHGKYGFGSADFFAMFLENVTEGLFADPMYGGNRNMIGWKWVGFPGDPMAHGDQYAQHFGKWHEPYRVAPRALQ